LKSWVKKLFLLSALMAGLNFMSHSRVTAQTFTNLYSFTNSPDGAHPLAGLILSGKRLYGTANQGGVSSNGTVFAMNTDGTGFTNLYSFTAILNFTNSDGAIPNAGLILSGNTLYGTASRGGTSGNGTVFRVNIDGSNFTNLHSFSLTTKIGGTLDSTNSDGANPYGGLVLSGNTLYGTARNGGNSAAGTVFAVNTDGTDFTNLHIFSAIDGALPYASLILSGNTLYGTTERGGSFSSGTIFAINTNGKNFTNFYNFTAYSAPFRTNSDGATPNGLILSGNTLYGTAQQGGIAGLGNVFAVNTNGISFTNLYSFTQISGSSNTNGDGAAPESGLILSGNTLYGAASGGGISGNGTLFAVNTDGTGFTNLYNFIAGNGTFPNITNSDGVNPLSSLVLSGNALYGTAPFGGSSASGTVFRLSLPLPQLAINLSGNNLIVSWPLSVAGFTLQTNDDLNTTNWVNYDGAVINNSVTNLPIARSLFFRLQQ
jgi:uncharacterized repeat protein (TIGR03803 family)